jgi:thiamine pyrophosphate-dependent acetolactate synthase large subunit-like protein
MGVDAAPVGSARELEPVLEEAFASGKPYLVNVPTAAIPAPELAGRMSVPGFKPLDFRYTDRPI